MSTRAVIARRTPSGWFGCYHHSDGYPEGLGKTLYGLYNGHFHRDLNAMLSYLIDQHPAGWSTINRCDFTQPPGFRNARTFGDRETHGPVCYCHGDRAEEEQVCTEKNSAACGAEYAYVFDTEARWMQVLSDYLPDGRNMIGMFGSGNSDAQWFILATIFLDGPEPDWATIA